MPVTGGHRMTDSVLNILKFALLALLYLFFARVLWAVWSEVRGPRPGTAPVPASASAATPPPAQAADAAVRPPGRRHRAAEGQSQSWRRGRWPPDRAGAAASKGTAIGLANEVTFGRAAGCTVSVPDDTLCFSGARPGLRSGRGSVIVEDLGSTNGTYVNGNRITHASCLHPGDRIQFGTTVLEAN